MRLGDLLKALRARDDNPMTRVRLQYGQYDPVISDGFLGSDIFDEYRDEKVASWTRTDRKGMDYIITIKRKEK